MANSWLLSIFGFLLTANISFADIGVNQRMDIWDSNGQLQNVLRPCSGDVRHHWWNENGQLTATVDNSDCSYFGYDGNGERVYKLTGQSMLDQYNAGEQNFQMYFNDAVLYVNPYMTVTPTGYTKHYYNGSQRIATRIGELDHLPEDIIDTSAVALERITNAREYMHEMLNVSAVQTVDTASVFADIEGNGQEDLQWQCMEDAEWMFHAVIHCDSNLLYPILTMDSTHLNQDVQGIYYYHPDHLGSANWITDLDERPVEYLHYMPYGEPWQEQHRTTYDERYKFTGKERDAETEYDYFGARYYASVLPTWLSVDPLSDKYPSISPYAYCNWNPVKYVDLDGRETHVKKLEDGTYEVIGGILNDDRNIYVFRQDEDGYYTFKGNSIGETLFKTSFYNSDRKDWVVGSVINPYDQSGLDFLYDIIENLPALRDYMDNAGNGEKYDFKTANCTDNEKIEQFKYRGMPISFNKQTGIVIYTSARDIGNIAAGYVAGSNGMSWKASRIAFDIYQISVDGTLEGRSTRNAEYHGWRLGIYSIHPTQKAENLRRSIRNWFKKKK